MDIQTITQFIGSVGFPIFMSVALLHYMQTEQEQMRATLNDLKEAINSLIAKMGDN